MSKSSKYNPRVVKTQGIIRHYGWLNREQGPKMDLKFAGESWNLVQRRLHGMEGREGSIRDASYQTGQIVWGTHKGASRAFQSGSCVYGSVIMNYPYKGIDFYPVQFQFPPIEWDDFPEPIQPIFCADLWEAYAEHEDKQITANAGMQIYPDAGNDLSDCWDWGIDEPPVIELDCDFLYDQAMTGCSSLPEPERFACMQKVAKRKELGRWDYPDCWGMILPPPEDMRVRCQDLWQMYPDLKDSEVAENARLVVWPEGSAQGDVEDCWIQWVLPDGNAGDLLYYDATNGWTPVGPLVMFQHNEETGELQIYNGEGE